VHNEPSPFFRRIPRGSLCPHRPHLLQYGYIFPSPCGDSTATATSSTEDDTPPVPRTCHSRFACTQVKYFFLPLFSFISSRTDAPLVHLQAISLTTKLPQHVSPQQPPPQNPPRQHLLPTRPQSLDMCRLKTHASTLAAHKATSCKRADATRHRCTTQPSHDAMRSRRAVVSPALSSSRQVP
jgi:hypothetical protein